MAYFGIRQFIGPLVYRKIKEVRGAEHLPPRPPFVIAANHVGFLDAPALVMFIWYRYSRLTHYITKRELWKLWGGSLARRWMGMIPLNDDRKADSLREAIKVLQQGEIIGVFPEGTRNPAPQLLKGKTGAVRMALATGAPLIPIGLFNTTGQFLSSAFKSLFEKRSLIRLTIGRAVDLSAFKGRPIDRPLLEAATRKLMNSIGELCGKDYFF
jgi:1-acyl-sn-glycerol-3-phosphate acyltransferase